MRVPYARAILRVVATLLLALHAATSPAQVFADEDRDWGVAPPTALRRAPYAAPTPVELPGGRVLRTLELKRLLEGPQPPLLVDVASGDSRITLAKALWLPGMGRGVSFLDDIQSELAARLARATGSDKAKPIVFFCVDSRCWLSYNASLRALALGYTRVYWYRGGIEAWRAARLPLGWVREPGSEAAGSAPAPADRPAR